LHWLHVADHFALPVNIDDMDDIQDPSSGTFFFMAGFDTVGDLSHPIGP
jgi:hypothetical protein